MVSRTFYCIPQKRRLETLSYADIRLPSGPKSQDPARALARLILRPGAFLQQLLHDQCAALISVFVLLALLPALLLSLATYLQACETFSLRVSVPSPAFSLLFAADTSLSSWQRVTNLNCQWNAFDN